MPNFNKIILIGHIVRDPELKYLPSNTPVVEFAIAVNRKWTNKQSGEQVDETMFVDCSAFARTAEVINDHMSKGKPIFIEGRLKQDRWQDKQSGGNRSKLSVVVDTFQFIDSRAVSKMETVAQPIGAGAAVVTAGPHEPLDASDIPF